MASTRIADQGRTGRTGASGSGITYQRYRPQATLLYQLVEQHYPVFRDHLATQGHSLPRYVQREFLAVR